MDDISHEGLRVLLREEKVTFQRLKIWKASHDPRDAEKKARIEHLYAIAGRAVEPGAGDPAVVFCVDELGPQDPRCATSPSTAPTTPPTASRPA